MATQDQLNALLADIERDINGFIGASIVDLESGLPLASSSVRPDFDLEVASAFNSEIVKNKKRTIDALGIQGELEDMLLTLNTQLHLLKMLDDDLFIYLAADRQATNLALLRSSVNRRVAALGAATAEERSRGAGDEAPASATDRPASAVPPDLRRSGGRGQDHRGPRPERCPAGGHRRADVARERRREDDDDRRPRLRDLAAHARGLHRARRHPGAGALRVRPAAGLDAGHSRAALAARGPRHPRGRRRGVAGRVLRRRASDRDRRQPRGRAPDRRHPPRSRPRARSTRHPRLPRPRGRRTRPRQRDARRRCRSRSSGGEAMTGPAGRQDAAATPDPSRMHPDVAGNWALWSRIVGPSAQARLQQLEERFPELTTAVLGTADGLHIASLGVDPDGGEQLAAMNGSLFGVARAEAEIIAGGTEPTLSAIVSLSIGENQMALLSFILAPYGQLLLSVSASSSQLGTVIVHARSTAYELLTALGVTGSAT
ncbi:unnamed protein product [Penicillium discolor]